MQTRSANAQTRFAGVKKKMDYNSQGGACFLGVKKVVVKSHGASKAKSITASILQAKALAESRICEKISDGMSVLSKLETEVND